MTKGTIKEPFSESLCAYPSVDTMDETVNSLMTNHSKVPDG